MTRNLVRHTFISRDLQGRIHHSDDQVTDGELIHFESIAGIHLIHLPAITPLSICRK